MILYISAAIILYIIFDLASRAWLRRYKSKTERMEAQAVQLAFWRNQVVQNLAEAVVAEHLGDTEAKKQALNRFELAEHRFWMEAEK
jgi:hypothetical protein